MITPQNIERKLANTLGLHSTLYLKREDLHPLGSHKGRSIPTMIDMDRERGARAFAVPSSGNAALAALLYIREIPDITLRILVGKNVDETKFDLLKKEINTDRITIKKVTNPLRDVFQLEKNGVSTSLRQSTNDNSLIGYRTLADELMEIDDLRAIFIPTSSGTTAQAIGERIREYGRQIEIHIVQTPACHPMTDGIDTDFVESSSIAGAIVDKIALRKDKVRNEIRKSGGSAWVVDDQMIREAIRLAHEGVSSNPEISVNSALSIAGLKKAIIRGRTWNGSVVCLITGR